MTSTPSTTPSPKRAWTGRVLSALSALLLLLGSLVTLVNPHSPSVAEGMARLGYPSHLARTVAALELGCTLLYLIPRTSVFGALLLTGYLGGAVASHVRVGDPLFSQALIPVYVALLLWGGLYLRDGRLRELLPFRSQSTRSRATSSGTRTA